MRTALAILAILALATLAHSCAPSKQLQRELRSDTVYVATHHRDTIALLDSVYVSESRRADTVYRTLTRTRYIYKVASHADTVSRTRADTIVKAAPAATHAGKPPSTASSLAILAAIAIAIAIAIITKVRQ